ncbi:MAG TPA: orotate phosphoribosyltransferase [Desulfobacteria bacterium]|nr:orotate phosphoribosyltransferase [Desulfobacteria bacterium]
MTNDEVMDIFAKCGALKQGHFRYTSGLHGNRYMQCAQVLKYPEYTEILCKQLADQVRDQQVELVVGPAMGGILVAYEVARQLGVPGIFSERENGEMKLRRGFTIEPGQRVLVVEDVVTTGGSVQEVINIVKANGGVPVGVAVLVNRSGGKAKLEVPIIAMLNLDLATYEPEHCPMCKEGLPVEKPGSRQVKA